MKTYIGIDNGVSGSIAIIDGETANLYKIPVVKQLSYTKTKQYITRINIQELLKLLVDKVHDTENSLAIIERPMINPTRFKATISAARSLEALLIALELRGIPYMYMDSKEWQKTMLPKGLSGDELKHASLDVGNRLFPYLKDFKHPDRDSLLIAEYARIKQL